VTEVFVRYPVHCPVCNQEWSSARTKQELLDALDNHKPISAYAECHDWRWDLNEEARARLSKMVRG
jgi:hypothetical protein